MSALITLAIALLLATLFFYYNDSPARSILTTRSRRALAAIVDTLLPGEALIGKPTSTLPGALDAIEKVTASGANPMVTNLAVSHMVATRLAETLKACE